MTYDITVGFSNGITRNFTGITKIESRIYIYDKQKYDWKNIENPLDYEFKSFGDYRLTSKTKSFYIFSYDSGSHIMLITSMKIKRRM